jgi:hypothetical protein
MLTMFREPRLIFRHDIMTLHSLLALEKLKQVSCFIHFCVDAHLSIFVRSIVINMFWIQWFWQDINRSSPSDWFTLIYMSRSSLIEGIWWHSTAQCQWKHPFSVRYNLNNSSISPLLAHELIFMALRVSAQRLSNPHIWTRSNIRKIVKLNSSRTHYISNETFGHG